MYLVVSSSGSNLYPLNSDFRIVRQTLDRKRKHSTASILDRASVTAILLISVGSKWNSNLWPDYADNFSIEMTNQWLIRVGHLNKKPWLALLLYHIYLISNTAIHFINIPAIISYAFTLYLRYVIDESSKTKKSSWEMSCLRQWHWSPQSWQEHSCHDWWFYAILGHRITRISFKPFCDASGFKQIRNSAKILFFFWSHDPHISLWLPLLLHTTRKKLICDRWYFHSWAFHIWWNSNIHERRLPSCGNRKTRILEKVDSLTGLLLEHE